MTQIKQRTQEWYDAKLNYIGGSEIYGLAHHYCPNELEALGINIIKNKPFLTAKELFFKIKYKLTPVVNASPAILAFGSAMEPYIINRLKGELNAEYDNQISICGSEDFIINEKLNILACCSPDGYINLNDRQLKVTNQNISIDKQWGEGVIELKTMRSYDYNKIVNPEKDVNAPAKYILQHQYQMYVLGKNWGVISILLPKENNINFCGNEFDSNDDFIKGIMAEKMTNNEYEYLYELYDLVTFVNPLYQNYQDIIIKSLKLFQEDLNNNRPPKCDNDFAANERFKKMMEQERPEQFGKLTVHYGSEIDQMLNERGETISEISRYKNEIKLIDGKLKQLTRKNYNTVIGTQYKLAYDKKGTMRVTKLKAYDKKGTMRVTKLK